MQNLPNQNSNLRVLLAKKRMNISEFSTLADVSRPKLYEIRDEIQPTVKIGTLMKVANALGIDWFELFDR